VSNRAWSDVGKTEKHFSAFFGASLGFRKVVTMIFPPALNSRTVSVAGA
jgi:hypothetical protein